MALNERDANILTHMLAYCDDIFDAVRRFGDSFEAFRSDKAYRNACAMCILQIGELAGHLSAGFRAGHSQMPWSEIKPMRNIVAHAYAASARRSPGRRLSRISPPSRRFAWRP